MRRWLTIFLFVPLVALGGCMRKCNCASTVGATTTTVAGLSTTALVTTTSTVAETTTTTIPSEYIIRKRATGSPISRRGIGLTGAELARQTASAIPTRSTTGKS